MDNWLFMLVINQWARRNVRMPALLYLECICRYIALVDCICMEDVWHANLTCRGHPHVPGNISSFLWNCLFAVILKTACSVQKITCTLYCLYSSASHQGTPWRQSKSVPTLEVSLIRGTTFRSSNQTPHFCIHFIKNMHILIANSCMETIYM